MNVHKFVWNIIFQKRIFRKNSLYIIKFKFDNINLINMKIKWKIDIKLIWKWYKIDSKEGKIDENWLLK